MKRSGILLATTLACALGPQMAHAADLASATASITGLSYHLVDLDLNDGITPWVQFGSNTYVLASAGGSNQLSIGTPFDASLQTASVTGATASASVSTTGLQSSAWLDGQSIQNLVVDTSSSNTSLYTSNALATTRYGTLGADGLPVPGYKETNWTLSANTALVIDGIFTISVQVDGTQLAQGTLLQGAQAGGTYGLIVDALANASFSIYADGVYGGANPLPALSDEAVLQATAAHLWNVNGSGLDNQSLTQSFTLQITNSLASTRTGLLTTSVATSTHALFTSPAFPPGAPVPEPGTWALMGLGLGLMGWRVRATRAVTKA
ncbi:MAG TPA: PEP-CTERM sorting domain-containing protein [Candidatus Aquabacterium excrementipullorum]|nr:PEP-CTERM sorting domain-containing protein [Candidatus Aquabacterium excrementipullorum]